MLAGTFWDMMTSQGMVAVSQSCVRGAGVASRWMEVLSQGLSRAWASYLTVVGARYQVYDVRCILQRYRLNSAGWRMEGVWRGLLNLDIKGARFPHKAIFELLVEN